jgi:RNA 2',3'-cyclic 3'-phosphodiesterase
VTRAFVAARLPEPVLDAVAAAVACVSVPGRATTRDQWHVTLQFLGDNADVDAVVSALDGLEARRGVARVGGAGAFPDARHAHVLWLGLAEGADVIARLADAVSERTAGLGYERDVRPFRPHVTLARGKAPTDLRGIIAALGAGPVGPAWDVDAVSVYESRRGSGGATYVERATIPIVHRAS